jgi:hypothetical protein
MYLSAQLIASNLTIGSTNVYIQDTTMITNNVLIFMNGGTNEFVRIHRTANILPNQVILKGTNLYPHSQLTNCFNRVAEFSGFKSLNIYDTNEVYGTMDFGTNVTVNIKFDIEYTK